MFYRYAAFLDTPFQSNCVWFEFTGRELFHQRWVFTASTCDLIPSAPFIDSGEKCAFLEE